MKARWSLLLILVLALQAGAGTFTAASANAAGNEYRVYQYDRALKEFSSESAAVAYAKGFAYSHVEKTAGRVWVWDNFPRYKVYQGGYSTAVREFSSLADAKTFAAKLDFAQIRDLQQPGWIYGTYPKYRLYQGDDTRADWVFATLAEAKQAAKNYTGVHIIELASNQWVWDNMTAEQKTAKRAGTPIYRVLADGKPSGETQYAFLLDAIRAAAKVPDKSGTVVNTVTGATVYSNVPPFTVKQDGKVVRSFYGIGNAVVWAKTVANATVNEGNAVWWTNLPFYIVAKGNKTTSRHHTFKEAISLASKTKGSVVTTADGRKIWTDRSDFLYLGWNGIWHTDTILSQVAQTNGLDIDSPTWFELAAADGTLTDNSDPALVASMKKLGIRLTPLVHNQFDAKMTSAFLRDSAAKKNFIASLTARLAELGVEGMNLDFELLAGGDRSLYTAFVRELTDAAHQKGLTVSIDLPRGEKSWDQYTAYDHAALAKIVDMVMLMAYDQHWEGGDTIGSVGELGWVEEGVRQFLDYGISQDKLMLGVPFYVREWRIGSNGALIDSRAVLMKDVPGLISATGAKGSYDAAAGQMKYSYYKNGYTYIFWAETAETLQARVAIAKKYNLAGVAAWRLGFEDASLWQIMAEQK
ncbi:glycosyl hydrolase family 18 protein [Paenibacillus sp. GCM10027626]|uniref:glycosyl hydrolase family 18 protein n=1 Tax=Paenibacillus sp. GCM10027626 TaxID=3273411 RepID=UPI00363FAF59